MGLLNKTEAAAAIAALADDGKVFVRTETEDTDYISSLVKIQLEEKEQELINENTNKYHGFYDKDIKDILGREKEGEQKTYELNKVILGEHKDLLVKSAALQTRVTELEGMKGSDANLEELKRVRKELAEVREGVELSKTEWEKEKAGFNTTIASTKVQGVLNRGLSDIKWKPEYSKTIREQIVRNGQASLIENSDTVDGVTVFLDKDKKVRRGPDNVTALTAEEVQREDFADMILGEKKQEGTGGKPGENIDAETMVLPITVKTKGDLTKHLIEVCGFARNTPEYKKAYAKHSPDLTW